MKLSSKQKEVIMLMRKGWELHKTYDTFHLIKVGAGVKEVSYENFHCLKFDEIISSNYKGGPTYVYTLTPKGREIEI